MRSFINDTWVVLAIIDGTNDGYWESGSREINAALVGLAVISIPPPVNSACSRLGALSPEVWDCDLEVSCNQIISTGNLSEQQ